MNTLQSLQLDAGGRPVANDDFQVLQDRDAVLGLPALLTGLGPCVVSGCRVSMTGSQYNVGAGDRGARSSRPGPTFGVINSISISGAGGFGSSNPSSTVTAIFVFSPSSRERTSLTTLRSRAELRASYQTMATWPVTGSTEILGRVPAAWSPAQERRQSGRCLQP